MNSGLVLTTEMLAGRATGGQMPEAVGGQDFRGLLPRDPVVRRPNTHSLLAFTFRSGAPVLTDPASLAAKAGLGSVM